jgi:hypothetical protein
MIAAKLVAAGATTVLSGLGLAVVSTAPADAATSAAAAPPAPQIPRLHRSSTSFVPGLRAAALQSGSGGSLGAVTFVNDDLVAPASYDVALSGPSGPVGQLRLATGNYTAPQLLPAGTYTLAVINDVTGTTDATGVVDVAAGGDSSEVISGILDSSGAPVVQLSSSVDAVNAMASGTGVISVRNESGSPLDVYLNGSLAASGAGGTAVDLPVAPGSYQVTAVSAGGSPATPVFSGFLTVTTDTYEPVYLLADPGQSGGITAATTPFALGYQYSASDGGLFNYGAYPFLGSTGNIPLNQPMVGGAEATDGSGYWLVAADGGVFAFNAPYVGSLGAITLNQPIVAMGSTVGPNGAPGYLLVARDGGVFAFNAGYYGSLAGTGRSDVVGIAADPATGGYVIAEADGSYTQFGPDITPAPTSPGHLNAPIVGITETPDGGGAWLVGADGGVFAIGNAAFFGSAGNLSLNQPVVGLFPTFDGLGYDLIAADGGVFSYGNARFFGSTGNVRLNRPIVAPVNP